MNIAVRDKLVRHTREGAIDLLAEVIRPEGDDVMLKLYMADHRFGARLMINTCEVRCSVRTLLTARLCTEEEFTQARATLVAQATFEQMQYAIRANCGSNPQLVAQVSDIISMRILTGQYN